MKAYLHILSTMPAVVRFNSTTLKPTLRSFQLPKNFRVRIPAKRELKIVMGLSLVLLIAVGTLNFYGMFTDRFYFGQSDGWLFVMLAVVQITYMSFLWRRVESHEVPEWRVKLLEWVMYIVLGVYAFMMITTIIDLQATYELKNHIIADSFYSKSYWLIGLFSLLILVTLRLFFVRKRALGAYKSHSKSEDLDNWVPVQMEGGLGAH